MNSLPRVAFLPDTFHELNGVAHTSRQLEVFAKRENIPFLSIHCGPVSQSVVDGSVTRLELKRGFTAFALDSNLRCDPCLFRYRQTVLDRVSAFGAQIIHVTGPGDMGWLGQYVASKLKLPLAISWHTSLHDYAVQRLRRMLAFTGKPISTAASATAGRLASRVLKWFYTRGTILFAPNEEDVCMLKSITGRPCFLMSRGVDTALFRPLSGPSDPVFRLGYVGRLTPEKNVRFLAELGNALTTFGRTKFEFFIVGQGSEEKWLREHVPNAVFAGVLQGPALAQAYASMDLFVFPSHTDTFGNVVLEALSSGVPAIVTSDGGPKFLVQNGVTGYVAGSEIDFIRFVNAVMTDTETHRRMRAESRAYACRYCWTSVFHSLFSHYQEAIQ